MVKTATFFKNLLKINSKPTILTLFLCPICLIGVDLKNGNSGNSEIGNINSKNDHFPQKSTEITPKNSHIATIAMLPPLPFYPLPIFFS